MRGLSPEYRSAFDGGAGENGNETPGRRRVGERIGDHLGKRSLHFGTESKAFGVYFLVSD
jgi:hypothetical protein